MKTVDAIHDTQKKVSGIEASIKMHIGDEARHHLPPCNSLNELKRYILAACGAIILLIITQAISIYRDSQEKEIRFCVDQYGAIIPECRLADNYLEERRGKEK